VDKSLSTRQTRIKTGQQVKYGSRFGWRDYKIRGVRR
jgi:hypothetical protein